MANLEDRLQEVMAATGWEHSDVVRISGQSSSVVSQWLGKGSKQIHKIQRVSAAWRLAVASGFSAEWIAEGTGPRRAPSSQASVNVHINEPQATYGSGDLFDQLEQLLARVPAGQREALAVNLAGWAREGGAGPWKSALRALAATNDAPGKRSAPGLKLPKVAS